MKRIVSVILAMLMLVTLFGIPVYAETTDYAVGGSNFTSENFTVSNGVATASTTGATAKWDINYEGDAFVKLSLKNGSKVSVVITASGIDYTKTLSVSADNAYDFGCYTFAAGDSVSLTDTNGATVITGLQLVSVTATYLDTNDIDKTDTNVFSGWGNTSGLPNYDGERTTYYGAGTATWDVPDSVSSLTDIYYYFPENNTDTGPGAGLSDSSVTFTLKDDLGNIYTWTSGGKATPCGWQKVKSVDFTEIPYETITVTKGPDAMARLTAFKFVKNENPYHTFLITPESMLSVGDWTIVSNGSGYGSTYLQSSGITSNPTLGQFEVPNGTYYLYVNSLDYSNESPATRRFYFKINGTEVKKRTSVASWADWTEIVNKYTTYFGSHQHPGTQREDTSEAAIGVWKWEKASSPITVTNGTLKIQAYAMKENARFDAIMISQDPFITLDQDVQNGAYDDSHMSGFADVARNLKSVSPYKSETVFPENYQQDHASATSTASLSNNNTTISFKLGTLPDGNQSVQRQIKVGDVETVPYDSGLGFLVMYANSATKKLEEESNNPYAKFNTSYTSDGNTISVSTYNVFETGQPEWLIPTTLEQVDSSTVKMTATGTLADITAIWTLGTDDKEPKVSVTATTKQAGEYSFGFFNNVDEISRPEVGYVLNPYRWQESRFPEKGTLIPEAFSTTNHTQMTYKQNAQGQEITLGVAVDESSIERQRWTHRAATQTKQGFSGQITLDYTDAQSMFGMNTTGVEGGALPAVFAPLMGSETCTFTQGQTFEFSYRPLSSVSTSGENKGWYDCYSHVVKDLRGVYDFRDNYFASMTDTVFNILNLLKDDFLSGWSNDMLAHYYIEDTNKVSVADTLVYLQNYLLTDDTDLLMTRTLPSMAYMLTRNGAGFTDEYSYKGDVEGAINKELTHSDAFPNSSFEGAYLLSRGRMPVFRNIAKKKQITLDIDTRAQGLPNPSQGLWYDIANGNEALTNAVSYADNYLTNRSLASSDYNVDLSTFINTDYYPHFQSQLEMYEATGQQKYLDGAIEAARRALPAMRATDMPISKDEMYTPDVDLIDKENQWSTNNNTWFYDDTRYKRGAVLEAKDSGSGAEGAVYTDKKVTGYSSDALLPEATSYPFWVTSRVGLGLEQATTCSTQNANILMSTWAGELLRLGYLSNDQLMMDMARSSLVGRSSNYPGYYVTNYHTTYSQEDYPEKGFDSTQLYYTHIPPYLAALQDYLFSNAWVKSDGKIDFPYVRSQGYVWFNTRQYGYEPGSMYDEKDMWPWLKEGTITLTGTDAKQIDWIAGRKDGRAAFALTNASDTAQTVTVTFNTELGVANNSQALIYDKDGNTTTATIQNGQVTVTVPAKGILTLAVNGANIQKPSYAEGYFDKSGSSADLDMGQSALGLMYEGNTYTSSYNTNTLVSNGYSAETGYDVKAYALALDESAYMGYIFVGGRSADARVNAKNQAIGDGQDGITKSVLSWHYEGESTVNTVTDTKFPFEFLIPVTEDPTKKIVFNVETTFGNGDVKTLGQEYTLAPVIPEEEPEENYVYSDFEEAQVVSPSLSGNSYLEVGFSVANNKEAIRGYFYEDYMTKTTDTSVTGLYHTFEGSYVESGQNCTNTWSEFIDDVQFEGVYNGTKFTLPITNYGTTNSHAAFQVLVDATAFNNAGVGTFSSYENWTEAKLVPTNGSSAASLDIDISSGTFLGSNRIVIAANDIIATTYPEYFKVGPKVTAQSDKRTYATGYGALPNTVANKISSADFIDDVYLKFNFQGREIVMPIASLRTSSGHSGVYAGISYLEFNKVAGTKYASASELGAVFNSDNITDIKFTPSKVSIGVLPEGTLFISAMQINGGNTTGASAPDVIVFRNNTQSYNYLFSVKNAGDYDTYSLIWDDNSSTSRGAKVYVNGTLCDSYTNATHTLANSEQACFWEPTGTVTLNEYGNILNLPAKAGGDGNSRFGGIAFVPKNANFAMTSKQSHTLALAGTGLVDDISGTRTLSRLTTLTTFGPRYDTNVVNVTVDGVSVAVHAGVAQKAGLAEKLYNADGSFISEATVLDALVTKGVSLTNESGEYNAILADGKNVYPDRTLLYEGMAITTIDGGSVTKANFAPVLRDKISSLESNQQGGVGLRMLYNDDTQMLNYFPFLNSVSATASTTDSADNLINCQLNGYLTVQQPAVDWYIANKSIVFPTGTKVYFLGDKIINVTGRYLDTGTGATASYNSSAAIPVLAQDGVSYIHTPFYFYYQKATADGWYDSSEWFISNTSATDEVTANKIKDGKWQLLTTGTSPCQVIIVDVNSGAVKNILKDQVVTCISPLTITLEEDEKAFVWKSRPYNGPSSIFQYGIYLMKPLCGVLTY